jgi:hypothetical protein
MVGYDRSWVEAPTHEILGFVPSPVQLVLVIWIVWGRAGPLGGSVEHSEGKGGGGSVVAILRFLRGSSRLYRLRTEGLVPESKYWTYRSHVGVFGPSKPSSLPSIDDWLKSTASLAGLGEKLRWIPWTTQSGWEVESKALFLGSSSIR